MKARLVWLILCCIWGSTWLFIKLGLADLPSTVVASLTGLSRIEGPWRDLVAFFRTASTIRVKFAMLKPSVVPR